jgi:hypothetical protein
MAFQIFRDLTDPVRKTVRSPSPFLPATGYGRPYVFIIKEITGLFDRLLPRAIRNNLVIRLEYGL